jgi:hypothetical protein
VSKQLRYLKTLSYIKQEIKPGYVRDLSTRATEYLTEEGSKVEYVTIADSNNLGGNGCLEWKGIPCNFSGCIFRGSKHFTDNMTISL